MLSSAGNSASNSVSYTLINTTNTLSAEEMFKKLSSGSKTFAAHSSKNSAPSVKTSTDSDSSDNKISTSNINSDLETDTETNTENNVSYLYPKTKKADNSIKLKYGHRDEEEDFSFKSESSGITTSFQALAAAIGTSGAKITKEQLMTYLQSLTSSQSNGQDNTAEITFLKNLIAKFNTLSDGSEYITSLQGANDAQDYTTVTAEQVTSPIDIRI